jgi:hypothetical protein
MIDLAGVRDIPFLKEKCPMNRFVLTIVLLFCAVAPVRGQEASPAAKPPSFDETLKAAEAGNADAQLLLGEMYYQRAMYH